MTTATRAVKTRFPRRYLRFSMRTLLVITTAAALICWAVLTVLSTPGGRCFFSPDTLEAKYQSERLLWVAQVPVYRSSYRYERWEMVEYLIAKGYWQPRDVDDPQWIDGFHWNDEWRDGDSMLYRALTRHRGTWMDWTEANPEIAAVVWPEALKWLRDGHADGYICLLLFVARDSKSIVEFRDRVQSDPDLPKLSQSPLNEY